MINGIVNAEFICGKAEEELPKLLEQGVTADVVILDPPRSGCDPALLDAVASAEPDRIVYISCDPATQARDIRILAGKGYRFVEAQPVDMFPHTGHVECVIMMTYCGSKDK
ncbi:23S rRNA (uracil-C(5))-methyltransferase RlmCD [bioreactor metagenome]|uniref:23S rRNA (Uracil-C(5))-methyltransferase RlmCD n=1 Tax=bioreactor metagenome TaxID=1076179 RepID=A0A645IFP6_9ZZZZ